MIRQSFHRHLPAHHGGASAAFLVLLLVMGAVTAGAQSVKEQLRREAERAKADASGSRTVDPTQWPAVVAKVNGEEIHRIELMTQADLMRSQVVRSGGSDPGDSTAFYREVLSGLVGEVLVFQHARATDSDATAEEIAQSIAGMRSRFDNQAVFEAELERQGTNSERLQQQVHRALSIQKFIDQVLAPQITISEEAKRAFYAQNKDRLQIPERRRVRHIMLLASRDAAEDIRARANGRAKALRARLGGEADFAAMAREHSEDKSSSEDGGELGWVVRSGQRPEFEAAAFSLREPGEISGVVETAAGFHILQLVESQPARARSYEETEEQIGKHLKDGEMQRAVQRQVETLRGRAQIEIGI